MSTSTSVRSFGPNPPAWSRSCGVPRNLGRTRNFHERCCVAGCIHRALFRPFQLQGLTLPNRIVMAPMTRSRSPEGVPGADVAAYYRRRAEGEVRLIITEGTFVDHPAAGFDPNVPRFLWRSCAGGMAAHRRRGTRRGWAHLSAALACRHDDFADDCNRLKGYSQSVRRDFQNPASEPANR